MRVLFEPSWFSISLSCLLVYILARHDTNLLLLKGQSLVYYNSLANHRQFSVVSVIKSPLRACVLGCFL